MQQNGYFTENEGAQLSCKLLLRIAVDSYWYSLTEEMIAWWDWWKTRAGWSNMANVGIVWEMAEPQMCSCEEQILHDCKDGTDE